MCWASSPLTSLTGTEIQQYDTPTSPISLVFCESLVLWFFPALYKVPVSGRAIPLRLAAARLSYHICYPSHVKKKTRKLILHIQSFNTYFG